MKQETCISEHRLGVNPIMTCEGHLTECCVSTHLEKINGGDPRLLATGMTAYFKGEVLNKNTFKAPHCSGFTLIELLVVVLIIGILTAVALPQYQLAVDKARLSNLITLASAVEKAEELYYLANDSYATEWNKLDLDYPGQATGNTLTTTDGCKIILHISSNKMVMATHTLLPDVQISFFLSQDFSWQGRWCYAVRTNDRANRLCQSATRATSRNRVNNQKGEAAYNYRFS